ncbi:MAG: cytidine deaminase [Dysgonamonadaceae bacterium]|nr:cytidine deaminase [Dysgonamonadaceae bacterium]
MKNLNIAAKIIICDYKELNSIEKNVVNYAKEMLKNSYSPYSSFRVGAAVLLSNNEIISGSNQENAAYPSGLCAERTALFYANSKFPDESVSIIAVAAFYKGDYTKEPVTPCGACRQVIMETQNRYNSPVKLILYGKEKIYKVETISDLLPLAFCTCVKNNNSKI